MAARMVQEYSVSLRILTEVSPPFSHYEENYMHGLVHVTTIMQALPIQVFE
jgi:hypothetical protein